MEARTFITIFALTAAIVGCQKEASAPDGQGKDGKPIPSANKVDKLVIEDIEPGKGYAAQNGDLLTMLYEGKLANGKIFDGNMTTPDYKPVPNKDPFPLPLGGGMVISGWDKGLVGMKVGGIRKLSIPSDMGYGPNGTGDIPPNADLYFVVKCLDIVKKGEEFVIDTEDVKPGSGPAVKNGDKISVHYVGKLVSGKQFDSSRDRKKPFEFTVGQGEVVPGFDKGVVGMKKGGVRKVRIPPQAAYGAAPNQGLPGNSVLNFEIEILSINGK
jgi:peptidylprolyl isomerase